MNFLIRQLTLMVVIFSLLLTKVSLAEGLSLCSAEFDPSKAQIDFYFPLHEPTKWRWFRQETPVNSPEFVWEVIIPKTNTSAAPVIIGAYLFKLSDSKESWGTTKQLIAKTQLIAAEVINQAGRESHKMLPYITPSVRLANNGVILTVKGQKAIKRLKENQSKQVDFNIFHPDGIDSLTCQGAVINLGKN